jgi:SAM-dependent methyltransferase
MGTGDLKAHWEAAYAKEQVEKLGWFEENPAPSLELIAKCNLNQDSSILNVGAGATRLVDELLELGYTNIIANDLSVEALEKLKSRLGDPLKEQVKWIVDDLTNPRELTSLKQVNLWHDRAALHFFTDNQDQDTYFNLIRQLVKPGGYAIIAAFNLKGVPTCCGLPVFRYNQEMLQEKLGQKFVLQEAFDYTYVNPSGDDRPYVYTLFKRVES